jgi:Ca2+-transporting ATPase
MTESFFSWQELSTSIVQGIVITVATLGIYQYAVMMGMSEEQTRTMVFLTLISANILLTLVNRSFFYSLLDALRYPNALVPLIIGITALLTALLLLIPQLRSLFEFDLIGLRFGITAVAAGCLSVVWYEAVKWFKRQHMKREEMSLTA